MNEIVGTLYFVLAHDSNEDWAKEAEADTYFLFNSLMVSLLICSIFLGQYRSQYAQFGRILNW
jgi:hypothetical protein